MLQINPKKFKTIKNKTIPNPLRPKFRNKAQSNIYFLSKRKVSGEKKDLLFHRLKIISIVAVLLIGGYILSN
tara:strand:- start:75 stop:290 length:216 start_codon:yes stop_codon:yes gene_type:complete